MSVTFKDLATGYTVEVKIENQSNGKIALFDHIPYNVNLEKLPTLPFKIIGLNSTYLSDGNDVCVMIQIPDDYPNLGWSFIDQDEIDEWKSLGWKLIDNIDKSITVYLINIQTVDSIKSKGVSLKSYGHSCVECKDYFPYAEANMSDGRLLCYSCRSTCGWKYR
jgi:hypothetical protein